ncbi:subtilase-type protease inhibitor [Streptomyces ficellus]|uniref:Probable subtilase-type protease inhibitor n=1 Tax=Streptomyces ficellus TaxID=1977088 RepID=A0A6I6FHJ2_9ACTN|nr:subtilase-type protease inhibitor [Streptomyces ficellus]QGV76958.1 alkaline protease [Streptomyces ficellus]
MRTLVRRAVICGLATAGVLGPVTVPAAAAEAAAPAPRLYAPTALVLTVAQGETAATAVPLRAVTLTCSPKAGGSHPAPEQACGELRAARGSFDNLGDDTARPCVKIWDPVVVTAQGIWEGQRVNFEKTYGNSCMLQAEGSSVFSF